MEGIFFLIRKSNQQATAQVDSLGRVSLIETKNNMDFLKLMTVGTIWFFVKRRQI